jgi:CspA family cold shock protein
MTKQEGEVKWFNNERGYGFIHPLKADGSVDEGTEYFVHFTSVQIEGFKTLQAKQKVTFDLKHTEKGIQAIDVTPVK